MSQFSFYHKFKKIQQKTAHFLGKCSRVKGTPKPANRRSLPHLRFCRRIEKYKKHRLFWIKSLCSGVWEYVFREDGRGLGRTGLRAVAAGIVLQHPQCHKQTGQHHCSHNYIGPPGESAAPLLLIDGSGRYGRGLCRGNRSGRHHRRHYRRGCPDWGRCRNRGSRAQSLQLPLHLGSGLVALAGMESAGLQNDLLQSGAALSRRRDGCAGESLSLGAFVHFGGESGGGGGRKGILR